MKEEPHVQKQIHVSIIFIIINVIYTFKFTFFI